MLDSLPRQIYKKWVTYSPGSSWRFLSLRCWAKGGGDGRRAEKNFISFFFLVRMTRSSIGFPLFPLEFSKLRGEVMGSIPVGTRSLHPSHFHLRAY